MTVLTTPLFLTGMPWGILLPMFLLGVAVGIYVASRGREHNS